MKSISQTKLIVLSALFFTIFSNYTFYTNVLDVYAWAGMNIVYLISLAMVLFTFIVFLFTLISSKYTLKPILIISLIVSSITSYFMNSYNVVIDSDMIRNSMQTELRESLDLLSIKLILYFLFLGVLPAYLVYNVTIEERSLKVAILSKVKVLVLSLLIIIIMLFSFSKFYTSFFREHKPLRYYTNPTYWMYSIGDYIAKTLSRGEIVVKPLGVDAKITAGDAPRKLVIVVVGEAARADHFSLNGYEKETNPLLKNENIVNFSNFYSCGTSTAISVPCMFSVYTKDNYSYKKGISTENVLDVLGHTKEVSILWRDNNSNSKGVATRFTYEDFKTKKRNTKCDNVECRDEGMLIGLDSYIKQQDKKDILIVLHQMGNHGPAYYKRYPKEFEKFTPACQTNQLESCTQESISNAYDNAILYTDYFLSQSINFLKTYTDAFDTTLIYMSDHGESLGENGLYLHGLPYFIAPEAQTHVGAFIWSGKDKYKDLDIHKKYMHANLFHTLLGLFEVQTKVYDENMDILK